MELDTIWSKSGHFEFEVFVSNCSSDNRYVIVRPGQLGEGPPSGVVNVIDGQAGSIQRADLAAFVLKAATEVHFPYIRKAIAVSSVHGTSWVKDTSLEGFDGVTKVEL